MLINITERAVQKIHELLIKRRGGVGIRVGVKTTGCSGLAYVLEYIDKDKFDPSDEVMVYPNFVVKISQRHLPYLRGLKMDWVKSGLNEGFEFINPNERDKCGCGESFRV